MEYDYLLNTVQNIQCELQKLCPNELNHLDLFMLKILKNAKKKKKITTCLLNKRHYIQ